MKPCSSDSMDASHSPRRPPRNRKCHSLLKNSAKEGQIQNDQNDDNDDDVDESYKISLIIQNNHQAENSARIHKSPDRQSLQRRQNPPSSSPSPQSDSSPVQIGNRDDHEKEDKEDSPSISLCSSIEPTSEPMPNDQVETEMKPKSSGFSLGVLARMTDLWTSAKERMFGSDYWIPTDPNEIVVFPPGFLEAHTVVVPSNDDVVDSASLLFTVCQGTLRNNPNIPLYHVTFKVFDSERKEFQTLSIFRSNELEEANDLYQSCMTCHDLFKFFDMSKDFRKGISGLLVKLKIHPLWEAEHIAARMGTQAYFIDKEQNDPDSVPRLLSTVCHPEGLYPMMIAIQQNHVSLVKLLMTLGADPALTDMYGNNAMHLAALASSQMLEELWRHESTQELLNKINNDGCTPLFVAIRNANPLCAKMVVGFGGELNIRCKGKSPLFEAMQNRTKSPELLKAMLEKSPSMLHEKDVPTGNTALHVAAYKEPLMSLFLVKGDDIDVNAKNREGQTALHMHAHRGDLGCVMTLAANNICLDLRDNHGDTALHLAVSKANLVLSRFLLCVGADPNIRNCRGDTPRHLAARLLVKDTTIQKELLRSLAICGAERCEEGKIGCKAGCSNRRTLGLMHSSSSSPVRTDTIQQMSTPAFVSASSNLLQIDHIPKNVPVVESPADVFKQQMCYDKLQKRLEAMRAETGLENDKFINLLSLDGGGIRGLVIIQLLIAIEKLMKSEIFDYFDWVSGTSTGALVAAGLAQGKGLRECQRIYLRFKDHVFDGWNRPYNTVALEQFIQRELGESTKMADLKWPRILLTTVKADYFPVKLEFMRNYGFPAATDGSLEQTTDAGRHNTIDYDCSEMKLWKALRCSSAAPTFFSSVDSKYIDGGIIANNPALDLLSEVHYWNTNLQYLNCESDTVSIGCMLSVGTGIIPKSPLDKIDFDMIGNPYTTIGAMRNLGIILIDQVTATEGAPVARARSWCHSGDVPFFRFSAPMSRAVGLDTKDDLEIAALLWDCVEYTDAHRQQILDFIQLLRLSGTSANRIHRFSKFDQRTDTVAVPGTEIEQKSTQVQFS